LSEPILNIVNEFKDPQSVYKVTIIRFPWTPTQYSKYWTMLSPAATEIYQKGHRDMNGDVHHYGDDSDEANGVEDNHVAYLNQEVDISDYNPQNSSDEEADANSMATNWGNRSERGGRDEGEGRPSSQFLIEETSDSDGDGNLHDALDDSDGIVQPAAAGPERDEVGVLSAVRPRRSHRVRRSVLRWAYEESVEEDIDDDHDYEEEYEEDDDDEYKDVSYGKKKRRRPRGSASFAQIKKRRVEEAPDNVAMNRSLFSSAPASESGDTASSSSQQLDLGRESLKQRFLRKLSKFTDGQLSLIRHELQQFKRGQPEEDERGRTGRKVRDRWTDWIFMCPHAVSILRDLFDV